MDKMNGIVPCLTIDGAKGAIDFYRKAFGAEEVNRVEHEDGKRLMHAHIRVNGSDVMMWDVFPEFGMTVAAPRGVTVHVQVDDADAWWSRAVKAGMTVSMPIADVFWGSRYGQLKDPFGHTWAIGAPLKDAA